MIDRPLHYRQPAFQQWVCHGRVASPAEHTGGTLNEWRRVRGSPTLSPGRLLPGHEVRLGFIISLPCRRSHRRDTDEASSAVQKKAWRGMPRQANKGRQKAVRKTAALSTTRGRIRPRKKIKKKESSHGPCVAQAAQGAAKRARLVYTRRTPKEHQKKHTVQDTDCQVRDICRQQLTPTGEVSGKGRSEVWLSLTPRTLCSPSCRWQRAPIAPRDPGTSMPSAPLDLMDRERGWRGWR